MTGDTGTPASDLTGKVTPDLPALIREELKKEFLAAGRAYKMLGAAGFAGYMALLFVSIAIWAALATVLASGTAAIIVAFIWAVAAAVLYVLGRQRQREAGPASGDATRAMNLPGSIEGRAKDLAGTVKRAFWR